MQQGQAQAVCSGLVPSVLTVVKYGNTVGTCHVAMVCPLVSHHLVFIAAPHAAANGAERYVVCILLVAVAEGELHLEHPLVGLPVDLVDTVDAVGQGIHPDVLHEGRPLLAALYAEGCSERASFYEPYVGVTADVCRW